MAEAARIIHTSHGLGWFDPNCVDCLRERWQAVKKGRDDLAEGMLSLLQHDYPSIRDADGHCAILWQWLDLVCKKVEQDRSEGRRPDPNFANIAEHARGIRTAIQKSSYLARRLYGGEEHRTAPCPEHEGEWSGIPGLPGRDCPHGCQFTGWLPEGANSGKQEGPDDV